MIKITDQPTEDGGRHRWELDTHPAIAELVDLAKLIAKRYGLEDRPKIGVRSVADEIYAEILRRIDALRGRPS